MIHVTPYDRLAVGAEEMERLLASGEHAHELINYFGPQEYAELAILARSAQRRRGSRGERVLIVPGIMGSQLGLRRGAALPPDVIWLDPIDVALGRLLALRHAPQSQIQPLGVMFHNYLRLKLTLERSGYETSLYDYDWRQRADELGHQLAARLIEDAAPRLYIVAHSMGGLVARAALKSAGTEKVARLIMLGTPNFGSFAPVQALRGVYPLVRRIAALDLRHSAEELAEQLFRSFESLYHLLPAGAHAGARSFFDPVAWPVRGPRPAPELLTAARGLENEIAPADERFVNVVGVGQDTVTGAALTGTDFRYSITRNGDGTVPAVLATLPGACNYYAAVAHSELPRNRDVLAALVDLLESGTTARLASHWSPARAPLVQVGEARLRRTHLRKIDWAALTPAQRREYLEHLNDPPQFARTDRVLRLTARRGTATRGTLAGNHGQRAQARTRAVPRARLQLLVTSGDIAAANAQALVAALLHGVRPAGALAAIDARIGGVIQQFVARRMISGEAGSVAAIPAVRGLAHAETVLLAGLGRFDRLDNAAIELAAQNVVSWCAQSKIRRFATVLWGAGTGIAPEVSFAAQLRGYLRALPAESHGPQEDWQITFCVRERAQLARVARIARRLVAELRATAADGPAVSLAVRRAAPGRGARSPTGARRRAAGASIARASVPQIAYLLMNELPTPRNERAWRCAVLTARRQAAVITEEQRFGREALTTLLRRLDGIRFAELEDFGAQLGELVLHPSIRAALHEMRAHPLAVVHDEAGSLIPWETLCLRGHFPAAMRGVSRRYAASQLSVARFSEQRRRDAVLQLLLVTNPTGDLPGADLERERLVKLLARLADVRVTSIEGAAATRARVLAELQSGTYDAMHYAGHAFFDARAPARSGIRCSDATVTGEDLAALPRLPALVVFNACESARVRRGAAQAARPAHAAARPERIRAHAGVAEALLRGGVTHYVGTWWPVGDAEAVAFAETLYVRLLEGAPIGSAVLAGRQAVRALRSVDWADYVHYGDPQFRLKELR